MAKQNPQKSHRGILRVGLAASALPPHPSQMPPLCHPGALSPLSRLFVLHSQRRRCARVGCSPPCCFTLSPHRHSQVAASLQELGCIPRARWSPDSRDEPGVARARGPPLSAGAAGPCHNEPCIEPLLPNRWRLQAQGEAKVRGQEEQSGGTAPLPTHDEGGGSQATPCPS